MFRLIIIACMYVTAGLLQAATPVWEQFETAKGAGSEPTLPDFSYAGYKYCKEPIPDVSGPVFNVTSYGAVPDDGRSDQAAIKSAIDAVERANGGVVYFPAGQYLVNTDADYTGAAKTQTIFTLNKGNIVLRGAGDGDGGTVIKMVNKLDSPTGDECMYCTPWMLRWLPSNSSRDKLTTISADARREQFEIQVASTSGLRVGQWVNLHLDGEGEWYGYMDPYRYTGSSTRGTEGIVINEKHQIAAISGNTVRFNEPLHMPVDASDGWEVQKYGNISNCGIEDIKFVGNWNSAYASKAGIGFPFVHHRSADDDGAFSGVKMLGMVDSWIRRCTFHDWNRTFDIQNSIRVSALQITETGSKGHSSGATRHGYGVLFGDHDNQARHWHGLSACYQAAGTVFWRCGMPSTTPDCHGGCPYATLADNLESSMIADRNGGADKVLPHHLRWYVMWNWKNTGSAISNYSMWQHRQQYVKPIVVGNHGNSNSFDQSTLQLYESPGVPVTPNSLFEAQLKLRLGSVPGWLTALAGGAADVTAPLISSVVTDISGTGVTVSFNEAVEKASAETAGNYAISGGVGVTAARLQANGYSVVLTTTMLAKNVDYTLAVSNVKDLADPANAVASGTQQTFRYELCTASTAAWQTGSIDTQSGRFILTYDATPLAATCDAVFALSANAAAGYSDCAILVRFNASGKVDARNGGDYAAVTDLGYAQGISYRFELTVDMAAHRYDVTVTPSGGSPVTIADNYAFRSEQAGVNSLRFWNLIDETGTFKVCDIEYGSVSGVKRPRTGMNGVDEIEPVLYGLTGKRIRATERLDSGLYLATDGADNVRPVLVLQ